MARQAQAMPQLRILSNVKEKIASNREKYVEQCRAELEARRLKRNRVIRLPEYVNNPIGFVRDMLDEVPWSKQQMIMEAVRDNRRVAVPSCHDSGKSYIASRIAAQWVSCHEPGEAFVVTTAPTTSQVRAILWREINRAHSKGNLPGRTNQVEWFLGNELVAFGRKPDDMDMTAFQGIHARFVLVIIDEACGVTKPLWDAADTLITNENSRILAIGNPDDPTSYFAEACKPGSGFKVMPISAFDTPNFTGEEVSGKVRELLISKLWVEEKRLSWGEQSPLWIAKVLGRFPEVGEDTLIGPGLVREAQEREMDPDWPVEIGCDVARYGSDSTVIYVRYGSVYKCWKKIRKSDLMTVCGAIVMCVRETGARAVKVDDIGLGGGVTDRLIELVKEENEKIAQRQNDFDEALANLKVYGVNVSGRAPSTKGNAKKFINLRAELYWNLRDLFRNEAIKLDDDDRSASQLSAMKYEVDSKGRIKIESKDDMKKRGMPSPDEADAVMLASAECSIFELPDWVKQKISSPKIAIFAQ